MEARRVNVLMNSIDLLEKWMSKVGTDSGLQCSILEYARGRGSKKIIDITRMEDP